jgi:DNA-binding MarR family transcriptional regulator
MLYIIEFMCYRAPMTRVEPATSKKAVSSEEMAVEAWTKMRSITHDPNLLDQLHALSSEAGILAGASKALSFLLSDQPISMRQLAANLRCDNSYVTTIVDSLEDAGVARREAHPTDRRIKVIVLTDSGRILAERAVKIVGTPPPAFSSLSEREITTLRDIMRKLGDSSS